MEALIYSEKSTLDNFAITLTEVPDPECGDSDLLIEVKSIGINPGEAQFRRTVDPPAGGYMILGYEFSGIVRSAGKAVSGFKPGDAVMGIGDPRHYGSYAALMAVDFRNVVRLPEGMDFDFAAAIPLITFTAWQSIFRFRNRLPEDVKSVLVVGAAGGVGSMALQLLKARTDVQILATASRPESFDWCLKMGADHVLNHKEDIQAQLKDLGLYNIDMIFSVNGLKESIKWMPAVIRPYGYLSTVDLKDAVDLSVLMNKSVTIFLETIFTRIIFDYEYALVKEVLTKLLELIKTGKVITPVSTVLTGLTESNIKEAHTILEGGQGIGKIVLRVAK